MEFRGMPVSATIRRSEPVRGDPVWRQRFWDTAWSREADRSVSTYIDCYLKPQELMGKSVIDVGCGDMHKGSSRDIASWSSSFTGADISGVAIDVARRNFPGGTFVCTSATFLPFRDRQFDVGISFNTIDLLGEEYFDALREMARVSSKGIMFGMAHEDSLGEPKTQGTRKTRHGRLRESPDGLVLVYFSEEGVDLLAKDLGLVHRDVQIKTRQDMLQILYGDSVDLGAISRSALGVKREMFVKLFRG